jgi:hypothetical protein
MGNLGSNREGKKRQNKEFSFQHEFHSASQIHICPSNTTSGDCKREKKTTNGHHRVNRKTNKM